jgi:hypothetical protein
VFAAFASSAPGTSRSLLEVHRGDQVAWSTPIADATAGTIALSRSLIGVALSFRADGPSLPLRGDPAGVLATFDAATGTAHWRVPFESTQWARITSIATDLHDGFVVGGSFGGTLRVGAKVVSSAGSSDGFIARVDGQGRLLWLERMGGELSDSLQGVAVAPGSKPDTLRIAITGTFSIGADILGEPLASTDDRSPYPDIFVAELDGAGARRWSKSFGSRAIDSVAGVAIDASGHVVVGANVHEVLSIAATSLVPRGDGDGLVIWFGDEGEIGTNLLIGGTDSDGITSIAAVGDSIILGGFFSHTTELGSRALDASGGDDAYLAALDGSGTVTASWHVAGQGREEITAVTAIPGGFVAGVAHTADLNVEDAKLPAPADPMTGAALIVRGL